MPRFCQTPQHNAAHLHDYLSLRHCSSGDLSSSTPAGLQIARKKQRHFIDEINDFGGFHDWKDYNP
jgi:hypothetical protein